MSKPLPEGLHYCDRCGEPRGQTDGKTSKCLCDGMVCGTCGYGLIRTPGSRWEPDEERWLHLPSIGMVGCGPCWGCKERGEDRRRFEIEILRTVEASPGLSALEIAAEREDAATKQVRAALLQLEREALVEEGPEGEWSPSHPDIERRIEGDHGLTIPQARERQRSWAGKSATRVSQPIQAA